MRILLNLYIIKTNKLDLFPVCFIPPNIRHVSISIIALIIPNIDDNIRIQSILQDKLLFEYVFGNQLVGFQVEYQQFGGTMLRSLLGRNGNFPRVQNPQTTATVHLHPKNRSNQIAIFCTKYFNFYINRSGKYAVKNKVQPKLICIRNITLFIYFIIIKHP